MGSTSKPRHHRKKPIRIVIGTAAILCVGITLWYHHRAQPSFKRAALYTPGTVVVTAIDGAPSQGASSQSTTYVPRSEAALPSGTSPSLSAFSLDLSVVDEETTSDLAAREDLGVGDVGNIPAGDELSAAKTLPLNPLADRRREEEVTLDKETVEETGDADYEDDGQGKDGDEEQQNEEEEEESGEVMEEEWEEGAEGDDDYNDDDDFLFGETEEEEEEVEEEEEMEKEEMEMQEQEEEEKTLMEQDDAVAAKGKSSKLSRGHSGTATATEEKEEPIDPFLAECQASVGNRHFLTEDEKAVPPILYSFPGSGNTWTRVLIDISTGIYSGTIFGRPNSTSTKLPGQGQCHQRVSVIKAHPNHFSPQQLFNISPTSKMTGRCNRIGKITSFKRFILLTRNPFDAIWSEYRRTKKSHVILRKDFNASEFSRLVLNRYSVQYKDMILFFREIRRTLPTEDIFTLQYENMLDQDVRLSILSRMIDFIGLNKKERPKDLRHRLQCAFVLAEHVGGGRRGNKVVEHLDVTEIIKTKDVYVPEVACRMWAIFGAEATVLGYTLPNGITEAECEKFEAEA